MTWISHLTNIHRPLGNVHGMPGSLVIAFAAAHHRRMQPRVPLPDELPRPFTTHLALELGVGRERLRGADLVHPFRGVNSLADRPLTHLQRCEALQLILPPTAFFCGSTAARLMGVPLPSRLESSPVIHVGVPSPLPIPTGRLVRGHRYRQPEFRTWSSVRVSTPTRVWCELATELGVDDLVAAGDYLIHWRTPLATQGELCSAVGNRLDRRGIRKLRQALGYLNDRSESRRESLLRVLLVRAKLAGLEVNLPITTSGGFRYRADLAFRRERVLIEYQSAFHESPERYRADMTRRSRLEADGWFVIEVNSDDMRNPDELVTRVRRVLATR